MGTYSANTTIKINGFVSYNNVSFSGTGSTGTLAFSTGSGEYAEIYVQYTMSSGQFALSNVNSDSINQGKIFFSTGSTGIEKLFIPENTNVYFGATNATSGNQVRINGVKFKNTP